MPYDLDLTGCWAKLDRASYHVGNLLAEIADASDGDAAIVPLRRQFEADQRAIVYRVDRLIEVRDHWSLIVGDAVHNFRSALDHLAWQLALRYFNGVTPSEAEARKIQFPIVYDKTEWFTATHRKFMLPADADKLEKFQPFNTPAGFVGKHFLDGLREISNSDKHRILELIYTVPHQVGYVGPHYFDFIDCIPSIIKEDGGISVVTTKPTNPLQVGDEIARIYVTPKGPNPDVDLKARLTAFIGVRERWNLLEAFDWFGVGVMTILGEFTPPEQRGIWL